MSVHANVQQVFAIYMHVCVCLPLHLLVAKSYIGQFDGKLLSISRLQQCILIHFTLMVNFIMNLIIEIQYYVRRESSIPVVYELSGKVSKFF